MNLALLMVFSIDRQLDGREEFLGSRLRIELERPISNDGELHDGDWVIFLPII